jgi:hypothetical protein
MLLLALIARFQTWLFMIKLWLWKKFADNHESVDFHYIDSGVVGPFPTKNKSIVLHVKDDKIDWKFAAKCFSKYHIVALSVVDSVDIPEFIITGVPYLFYSLTNKREGCITFPPSEFLETIHIRSSANSEDVTFDFSSFPNLQHIHTDQKHGIDFDKYHVLGSSRIHSAGEMAENGWNKIETAALTTNDLINIANGNVYWMAVQYSCGSNYIPHMLLLSRVLEKLDAKQLCKCYTHQEEQVKEQMEQIKDELRKAGCHKYDGPVTLKYKTDCLVGKMYRNEILQNLDLRSLC